MKESLCFDTDVCVDFLRNREPGNILFSHSVETYQCYLSAITVYELTLGAEMMKRFQDIRKFIASFSVLPFSLEVAQKAAEVHAKLRKAHKEIGLPDIFIAATCLVNNIPLITRNKNHYQRVEGLKLLD
ncbi:MAG: type II toxin-antitoxin system VapC family toxin [Candidatus Margulisiibacteriota bacterium]